jgi:hypothetical protein
MPYVLFQTSALQLDIYIELCLKKLFSVSFYYSHSIHLNGLCLVLFTIWTLYSVTPCHSFSKTQKHMSSHYSRVIVSIIR